MPQEYDVVDLTSSDDNNEGNSTPSVSNRPSQPQGPTSSQPTTARRRRRSQAFDEDEDEDLEGVLTHRPVRRISESDNNDIEVVSTAQVSVNPLRAPQSAPSPYTQSLDRLAQLVTGGLAPNGHGHRRLRTNTPTTFDDFPDPHSSLGWSPYGSELPDEDDITVEQTASVRRRRNSEDIQVVDHKQITPQERLRQIQESHARGQAVNPRQVHQQSAPPPSRFTFGRGNQLQDLFLGRSIDVHDVPGGGFNLAPGFPFGHHGGRPNLYSRLGHLRGNHGGEEAPQFGPGMGPFGGPPNLEESVLERALRASLDHFSNRKPVDAHSVMKPPEPTEARAGFTRTLEGETELVCVKCHNQLGEVNSESKTDFSRNLSPKVFVRGCGHVYCGVCVHLLKASKSKDRACPVTDCKIPNTKKRGLFREVFL